MSKIKRSGSVLLVSGPSGCGKSSLLSYLFKKLDNYYFSISTTTRAKRDGEVDGIDYFFTTKEEFETKIEDNQFLEYAIVHQQYYGTSLVAIEQALKKNKLVILDIDVQGFFLASKLLSKYMTSVLITTDTQSILEDRLKKRNTNDNIKERLNNSNNEVAQMDKYDYVIVNDNLQKAQEDLLNIAKVCSLKASLYKHNNFLNHWVRD